MRKTQHINEIPNSTYISIASFEENLMNNQQNLGTQRDPYLLLITFHYISVRLLHTFPCKTLSETSKT